MPQTSAAFSCVQPLCSRNSRSRFRNRYSTVGLQRQSNGNVILHAYGSPGASFDFQASTNLQTWQDLGNLIADTNGLVQFDDTNAPSFNYRFYYTVPQ
jgi:hypothetical protein